MNISIKDTDIEKNIDAVREINGGERKLIYVLTFGCQQNEADSEKIRGMAVAMGYTVTDTPEGADLIVVNTCAVRKHAEMKALSVLGRFKAQKKAKSDTVICVVGCMAAEGHIAEMLKKDFHYVSFTLEPGMIYKFPELLLKVLRDKKRSFVFGSDEGHIVEGIDMVRESKHRAWVSVMYGCNNFCSYCIVPYTRGRERSRESRAVLDEVRSLAESGYKEITLLGQNVNSYKSDMNFASLLDAAANIPGDFIIRFMTSHPKDVSGELISVMAKHEGKIAPYFHLPLQSGSDRILKTMNRTYGRDKFLSTVYELRSAIPNIALSTDIIVGFPGEEEEDFSDTLDVLEKVKFDMVYAFIYSKREGTRAALFECQVDDGIKSERLTRLLRVQDGISYEKNLPYLNTIQRVLVDSVSKNGETNTYTARTLTNKLVHFESQKNSIGEFINVKINRIGAFDLFGEEI